MPGELLHYYRIINGEELGKICQYDDRLLADNCSIPGRAKRFFFSTGSRLALGPIQPPTKLVLWAKTDHSSPSSTF
jgi:hypothetical protein